MKIVIFDAGRRNHIQTGYGTISHHFGTRLANRGYDIFYYDEHIFPGIVDMWLWIRPPHYVKYKEFNPDNINVFYTMCEQPVLKEHKAKWPQLLNKCEALITPTEWNRNVWINNGVTIPIYVSPLGVAPKIFKGHRTYQFSILSVFDACGSNGSRENWKDNIKAYFELFYGKHCDEVLYTIKSWTVNWENYRAFIKELIKEKNYDASLLPPIQLLDFELVETDMNELYSKHWMFLKNSRGEGWSLPGLEAMASGLKIGATPLPSMVYLNEDNCTFFNDYEALKNTIWKHWKQYRKWRMYINTFSWKEAVRILDNILKEIYANTKT